MGTSTPVTAAPYALEVKDASNAITTSHPSLETAKDKPQPTKEKKTIPHRLEFVSMPGREAHWKVTAHGEAIIPSPIPALPKPLALSYRNFYNHYEKHEFIKKEKSCTDYPRALVGCSLISAMLRHYFPSQEYMVKQVWPGRSTAIGFDSESIVEGVPIAGTQHWVVQWKSSSVIVAVVVIVTDPVFCQLPARTNPTLLAFMMQYLDSRGRVVVDDDRMSRGALVLLAGTWAPTKPSFEFYKFDSRQKRKGELIPVIIQAHNANGVRSNSVSLAPVHAAKVDHMFKAIVHSVSAENHSSPKAVLPTSAVALQEFPSKRKVSDSLALTLAPTSKRSRAEPQAHPPPIPTPTAPPSPITTPVSIPQKNGYTSVPTQTPEKEITEAYVRTVKENKAGYLIEGATGHMISNAEAIAIRQKAEAIGHTFDKLKRLQSDRPKAVGKGTPDQEKDGEVVMEDRSDTERATSKV